MEAAIVYMWTGWYSAHLHIFKQTRREQKTSHVCGPRWLVEKIIAIN